MRKEWVVLEVDNKPVEKLSKELGVDKDVSKLLVLRGIRSYNEAKVFFRPSLSLINNPLLMKDIEKATLRIHQAIKNKERILVYGDYDVDGTTSVALMYSFLKDINANVEYYLPCRYNEGYGLSVKAIENAKFQNYSLIIALDCGIRALQQVDIANSFGIDIIICDHHKPGNLLPNAFAILNPKQNNCNYPFKELSGCGVGFQLIRAYSNRYKIDNEKTFKYIDLLALSIFADIVPLKGDNRILAYYGLKKIKENPNTGIKALINLLNYNTNSIGSSNILFGIAPRINAAGRIDHAEKAVSLLIENDYVKAKNIAYEIDTFNNYRKELQDQMLEQAINLIDKQKKSIVIERKNWHKGIVGIVSAKLVDIYHKPTIVFAEEKNMLTGSARSIEGFDMFKAISQCNDLCEKFGGHKYACGLTIKKEKFYSFREKFENIVVNDVDKKNLQPKLYIDLCIDIDNINNKLIRIIKQFEPHGPKNPKPLFMSKKVRVKKGLKQIGEKKNHLRMSIDSVNGAIQAVAFGFGNLFEQVRDCKFINICYYIEENFWQGSTSVQLNIQDIELED